MILCVYNWTKSACRPCPENIPDEELYKRLQGLPRDAFGMLLTSSLLETPVSQLDCYHSLTSSSRSWTQVTTMLSCLGPWKSLLQSSISTNVAALCSHVFLHKISVFFHSRSCLKLRSKFHTCGNVCNFVIPLLKRHIRSSLWIRVFFRSLNCFHMFSPATTAPSRDVTCN